MPKISIILPAWNAAATIADTLRSITAQTFPDWEAIVVDDGSTDGSRELVARLAQDDPRIRPATHPGKGPSAARNHAALALARGEILAFCDADDIWSPTKLAEVAEALDDPQTDGCFGRIAFFHRVPADARSFSTVPDGMLTIPMLLGENPVCTMSNLSIRRAVFAASGGFDTTMVHNEDLEWLIRVVGGGARIRGIDRLQVWYRASTGGLSADLPAMRASRARALQTARRFGHEPDPAAEAVYLRYLARRALRLDLGGAEAMRLALQGLRTDPRAFCSPLRRGLATALGALAAPLLPRPFRRALFSH